MNNQTFFESKIRPLFLYMGSFASIIFSIAYIIVVAIMILGLEAAPTIETFVGFLIANLVAGACIAISLMIQGQDFAKNTPTNKKILEQYYKRKEAKLHSMTYYWIWAIIQVVLTRLLTVAAMTYIVIDICWQGNGQYTYFLMAIFNILMFVGFGLLGMVSMYDKFNNRYIPWVQQQIDEKKSEQSEQSTQKCEQITMTIVEDNKDVKVWKQGIP